MCVCVCVCVCMCVCVCVRACVCGDFHEMTEGNVDAIPEASDHAYHCKLKVLICSLFILMIIL